ncbi:hypothetical protein CVV68_20305 [Arthrobacter livingstonensis]|uniref:Uncharacterized protein n=1 Tax=Arthrobacter livingstonensis TaxID=670078 RepID=A0A2V5L0Y7_9MICC|nr:hypothetical protein CVV68_20305 [Arthrobacter livingstonensis]
MDRMASKGRRATRRFVSVRDMLHSEPEEVRLLPLDGPLLEQLVHAATTDARAEEVTAPIVPGPDWSAARITWLRSHHRDRRSGLDGPEG